MLCRKQQLIHFIHAQVQRSVDSNDNIARGLVFFALNELVQVLDIQVRSGSNFAVREVASKVQRAKDAREFGLSGARRN